jgi:hypothetical protein
MQQYEAIATSLLAIDSNCIDISPLEWKSGSVDHFHEHICPQKKLVKPPH